jgi:16S rRNA (uracil1498-N3)-methyltransferase
MHRFFLPPEQCGSDPLSLTGDEAHHALHVLRIRPGEQIILLDGAGHEFLAEVTQTYRDQVFTRVREKKFTAPPSFKITLLQALPKGKLIETVIQKATELGAVRIVPLLAERTVLHFTRDDRIHKVKKWRAIAVEAIKQCGSPWLPVVEAPLSPREFLERDEEFELALVGSLQADAKHPRLYLRAFEEAHQRRPQSVCVWIGPEGDFSASELEKIQAAGARPISLGPLVLRTDTAASYCLSILDYELRSPVH